MAWQDGHKEKTRQRILCSAAGLFMTKGYENVGINEIMEHADLTRGAFYAHFSSKAELYGESILAAALSLKDKLNPTSPDAPPLNSLVSHYLSVEHKDGLEFQCPLAFLVSDISQQNLEVRDTYTKVFKGFTHYLSQHIKKQKNAVDEDTSDQSLLYAATMIGGLSLARAINDEALALKLLNVCQRSLNTEHH